LRDLFDKARRCFKEVIASHNSLKTTESGKTFGSLARRDLHELIFLSVGQQASEIIGVDLDGTQMKISDHRGEIVLIVFWASWCGPCMADVPHEKALLEKFAGRRFIIVGVNGDDDLVQAVKAKTEHEIPFRSFRKVAPGISETLTDSWNVKAWPTTYILDSHGIIRYKQLRREQLDGPIEFLLTELEGKGGE